MAPVWLPLLLLSSLLKAQETPDSTPGVMVEADNSTGPYASTASSGPPETSGFVTPSNLPTVQEDDWTPAESFLYSGDSSVLEMSRCSRAFSLSGQTGLLLPSGFSTPLRPALDALANTANFLNMIFQASDLRESTVQEDMEWYHAMVRALLEADMLIRRALLTFDADPMSAVPQLVLCASRNPTAKVQTIILQDLSKVWEKLHPPAPAPDDSWFRNFKFPEPSQPTAALSKRVLLNDLSTLDTPKWRQGDSYVTNHSGVRWADAPFLDCEDGLFVSDWMLTLSTSFYGLKPDLTPEFRGVIRVDVNIQDIDLDQCAAGDGWFADTHQCNRTTMECIPTPGQGFRLGQYCCRCKEGYFDPEMIPQDSDGGSVNGSAGGGAVCYPDMPICLPCWPGCRSCQDGTPCWVQEAWLLRSAVLALQGVFMMLIFVSMLVAYRHRRNRRIRASGLLLLETILFGSLLLYFPVFIMYFKPSTFRCILLRWVRMLGFSIVYGTVTLKMYRVLKVFLSRTAQRVPYLSSLYLLRILGVMLMTVSWFLCAWTVGVLQNRDRNIPVFVRTNTTDGQGFNLCYLDRWDYMMAVAELLFLCWGSSLWTAVRPVPSAFHEPRYMGIAIHNELLLSSMFHLFRFTFSSLHPDWMLLLSFTHTHVTITVTLALLFIPKFLYVSKPGREEIAAEVYEDEVDLRRSGSYFNSSFHSAWSEHSGVDPDDFRDELKKLYAQLEVHKTKKMTANNPHLSKKRSSRCALGRSIIKRIAEIPESMSRQCSRDDKEGSFHTKSVIQSESSKRVPDSVTTSHKSSMKTPSPSPAMHKSQSDHYYVRERDPSLHDSMLKANAMKRTSHQSETDSLDIPLGLCKSASAHNLSIDINLLHPDHTRLQKSWSLTSTSKSSLEIFTKVTRASTLRTHSGQSLSISDQTRSALQSESFDKSDVCPWEVEQEESADKTQKHVTYANFMESEDNGPSSPKRLVCPWDNLPPVEKKPSEENEKFETDSPKPQAPVSASAPSTPRPKFTKDQRVFSFRTATSKWLSVKSAMASFDTGSKSSVDGKSNQEDSISQKSQESNSSRRPSMEKRSLQKSMTTVDRRCLVKQNAIRLSSGDSFDRSPRRIAIGKCAVYPWDFDEVQKDGNNESVFLSRQNSRRSISSWDTASSCKTPSTHRRGSNRITPVQNISFVDVYPWERAGTSQGEEGLKRQQTIKVDVCPWESQEQDNVREQGSGRGEACPWETQDIPVISYTNTSKDLQTQQSLKAPADVCPWETAESPQLSTGQKNEYVNVCPWDVKDKAESVYENLNPLGTRGTLSVSDVHPTASTKGNEKQLLAKSQAQHLGGQVTKAAEGCPWDFPDPPENLGNICPWEEGNTEPSNTGSATTMTIKVDVCSWETGHQDKQEDSQTRVSPLKAASLQSEEKDATRVNICPWDTDPPQTAEATKSVSPGLERSSDVLNKQDSVKADVCPWEIEEPKVLNKQDSVKADVCPWDTDEPKVLNKQDTVKVDVCPWEIEEPKVLNKQDTVKADVCPWDTDESKFLEKQDSTRADVCPWDTDEPKVLIKQESIRADVCPWDTEEPEVVKKGDSTSLETKDTQPSSETKVDILERDQDEVTENQGQLREEETPPDVSSEQVNEPRENLGRRDALCPWAMERSRSGSFTDNTSDVFTWEPENIPEEDEDDDAEFAAEALVFPPDL
ncbi:LOW QUALITY PROTEIN: probable G-protein coupled receptor 179 [Eleginops maclovinus]|uniref:LOW QUALITY PROTEIN: probable G-protein coupled receptor 179 n=1 Tax=Eleginops maclovinus TaxID=56733 RepID=UPI0030805D9D